MEENKKRSEFEANDKEIVYSQSVKAGKRIYYLDVKKNRKDEMFLAITESKKIVTGEGDDVQVSFEKHKIFLYKEDFEKFTQGLEEVIAFIKEKCPIPVIERTMDEEHRNAAHGDNEGGTQFSNVDFEEL